MSYASGKYAKFVCDTCGWAFAYKTAKTTWQGDRVCSECYEPFEGEIATTAIGSLTVSTP